MAIEKGRKGRFQAGKLSVVALLMTGAMAHHAIADASDYFDLTPEQLLSAHVVSVSKKEESLATAPAAVYVITSEDIARSGVTNIPDALRMAPGVDVAQIDSNNWAISIRGFNQSQANKLLVMIDGRIVYSPLLSGTYWEAQDYPLEDIDRIEVVRGPGGTLWGVNAVNGVINIITKKASDTQGGLISGGYGNYEKGFGTARYGGKFGQDAYYRVYGKYFNRDSYNKDNGSNNGDSWQNYRTGFRADWGTDTSINQSSLHGDAYHVDTDQFNQSFSFSPPYSSVEAETIKSSGANIMGVTSHNFEDGSSLKLQSYLDYTLRDQILYRDSRYIFDLESQYNFAPIDRHEIVIGATYQYSADKLSGSEEIIFSPPSRNESNFGVFAQDKITLAPNQWFLTLGSKLDHNFYVGWEVEPNARLSWTPDASQTVWAAVSRAVRIPSTEGRDLQITHIISPPSAFSGGLPLQIVLQQNEDYDSEDLVAYEIGYRKQVTPTVSLDTTAYANDYTNVRSFAAGAGTTVNNGIDPIHFQLPFVFQNDLSGEVYGTEIAATWNAAKNWKLSGSYSFMQMYLHGPTLLGGSQETAEGQSPNNMFNLRSYWNINEDWTLDTLLYYVSDLPTGDVNSHTRLDMNLGWRITPELHFNLIGQNLLDKEHREFNSANSLNTGVVPTSVFGKFTWQF